jgi:hypothetical protein
VSDNLPILTGEALIEALAGQGLAARAAGTIDNLSTVTLGLSEAAEVQGRILALIEGSTGVRWLVLIDGAELHHVRLADIVRISLSAEAARRLGGNGAAPRVPTRMNLTRRAGSIAAAVSAEITTPFTIELMFERFPQDDLAMLALNGVLDAVSEVLRRLTIDSRGLGDVLSRSVRGVLIHPVQGEGGLRLEGDRLVLELRLDGAIIEPVWPDDLIRDMETVLLS